ncbi:helix-turn-helix domain-containing protein [Limosilactobacillus sp. c10Ua_36]|uniref:helix-turn-helix domain-containing protein n=1 Tax=Limosilactobacillus sp. c10Ua_36 TaxID=2775910 RepID=UPI003FA59F69
MMWKLIQKELKRQGMSAYRLSKITGLSQNTLQNYKNGHEPSFSNVVKIADALGVSLDEFRSDKGNG